MQGVRLFSMWCLTKRSITCRVFAHGFPLNLIEIVSAFFSTSCLKLDWSEQEEVMNVTSFSSSTERCVVYSDQLLGAARIRKLVELLYQCLCWYGHPNMTKTEKGWFKTFTEKGLNGWKKCFDQLSDARSNWKLVKIHLNGLIACPLSKCFISKMQVALSTSLDICANIWNLSLLYILTSIWVLGTPNAGWNSHFKCFLC